MVVELVRDHDVARLDLFFHAPHGADRDDALDAELFHAEDVCPVIDVRGKNTVTAAVSRQKRYPFAVKSADDVIIRGFAEGRCDLRGLDLRQPVNFV